MEETESSRTPEMGPSRLIALTDGIFAFAMTLLIISINFPDPKIYTNAGLYLLTEYRNFVPFIISFLFLAFYWLNYSQQFHHIKKTNALVDVINILILLFVVLIPFSASMINDYPQDLTAGLFFNGNLLILTCLMSLNWWYCQENQMIVGVDIAHLNRIKIGIYFLPLIPLVALIIGLAFPELSILIYLLIPIFVIIQSVLKKTK